MKLTNIGDVKALLTRHGFRFSKSMGQNFLVAAWVPQRIAESAMLGPDAGVLEIGPGIGCLTEQLSPLAAKVVSVELDQALRPVLKETVGSLDNVQVIFGDVLRQDLQALTAEHFPGLKPVVCANLPYNVTTPILTALLDSGLFGYVTVMIQKEVARRLCAKPGTADYGAFTVYVNWHTEPEILFDVSPGCFIPQPKVTSSVIRLKKRETPPAQVLDEALFFKVVRAAFAQRRKTLTNALAAGLGNVSKQEVEAILTELDMDIRIRGEALGIPEFAAIANALSLKRK